LSRRRSFCKRGRAIKKTQGEKSGARRIGTSKNKTNPKTDRRAAIYEAKQIRELRRKKKTELGGGARLFEVLQSYRDR